MIMLRIKRGWCNKLTSTMYWQDYRVHLITEEGGVFKDGIPVKAWDDDILVRCKRCLVIDTQKSTRVVLQGELLVLEPNRE